MELFCGIDWAEGHHDVALVDADGTKIAKLRIGTGATGFSELTALFAEHSETPSLVPVAIETDKNLIVVALLAAGHTVYAINPRAVARYRERHNQAGGKSDPGDAAVLANILRTDRHEHRAMPEISETALAVRALARQHQEAIWARQLTVNRLRSVYLEFYPNALIAFPNLIHKAALEILGAAPTPRLALKLTRKRIVTLLQRSGRGDRPGLADTIMAKLHEPALRQSPAVEDALGHAVSGLISVIVSMEASIADLEEAMTVAFEAHESAKLLTAVPGLATVLGARVLGEIGDDKSRFATADGLRAFAGTAPITRASGRSKSVRHRRVKNKRLADACHWWAFASITKSPGSRAHYDRRRAAGDSHNAALRNLANKLLGRLWWCLVNDIEWDEDAAWPGAAEQVDRVAA
jgi:transposase